MKRGALLSTGRIKRNVEHDFLDRWLMENAGDQKDVAELVRRIDVAVHALGCLEPAALHFRGEIRSIGALAASGPRDFSSKPVDQARFLPSLLCTGPLLSSSTRESDPPSTMLAIRVDRSSFHFRLVQPRIL